MSLYVDTGIVVVTTIGQESIRFEVGTMAIRVLVVDDSAFMRN